MSIVHLLFFALFLVISYSLGSTIYHFNTSRTLRVIGMFIVSSAMTILFFVLFLQNFAVK